MKKQRLRDLPNLPKVTQWKSEPRAAHRLCDFTHAVILFVLSRLICKMETVMAPPAKGCVWMKRINIRNTENSAWRVANTASAFALIIVLVAVWCCFQGSASSVSLTAPTGHTGGARWSSISFPLPLWTPPSGPEKCLFYGLKIFMFPGKRSQYWHYWIKASRVQGPELRPLPGWSSEEDPWRARALLSGCF